MHSEMKIPRPSDTPCGAYAPHGDGWGCDPQLRAEKEKMRGLREEMRDAIAAYRAAEGEDKDRARDEVSELAEEIFDAKQSHRQRRLERIRTHVDECRLRSGSAENREALIEVDRRQVEESRSVNIKTLDGIKRPCIT